MLKTLAAALVSVSLAAGPVLAQGGTTNAPAATAQPSVKTNGDAGMNDKSKARTTVTRVHKTKVHVAKASVHGKHVKVVKHVKHHKYAKHNKKQIKVVAKPAKTG
jgi:hypothetical protein